MSVPPSLDTGRVAVGTFEGKSRLETPPWGHFLRRTRALEQIGTQPILFGRRFAHAILLRFGTRLAGLFHHRMNLAGARHGGRRINFEQLKPLLERLHEVGCERDKAGNRELHYDEFCLFLLLGLFNPVVDSLRGLQQASELEKVQQPAADW